jgi:2,3-bisphosphoglycerate-independent phosphoglycerate mutase
MRGVLIILDGIGDRPCKLLDGLTPLEAAKTPNLDWIASKSKLGVHEQEDEGMPESDRSIIRLLGNRVEKTSRGIIEAIGAGMKIPQDFLALRADFATIDPKTSRIIDRRVGRTLTTKEAGILAKEINKKLKLLFKFELRPTVQHRGVLVIHGNLSEKVTDTDPEYHSHESYVSRSMPLDETILSKYTSEIINHFTQESLDILNNHKINKERRKKGLLPANVILLRGAGNKIPRLKQHPRWVGINYMPTEAGITKLSGMKTIGFNYPAAEENIYETLRKGLKKACQVATKELIRRKENIYIHIKETDIPGHDGNAYEKKRMIEIIDKELLATVKKAAEKEEMRIVITGDHATPCEKKGHAKDAVPLICYNAGKQGESKRMTEKNCLRGRMGLIKQTKMMKECGLE